MISSHLPAPSQLSADPRAIQALVRGLTGAAVTGDFCNPSRALIAAQRLQYWRLAGVRQQPHQANLPESPLSGLVAAGLPFSFLLASDGSEVRIALGTSPTHAGRLATAFHSLLGGPVPVRVSVDSLLRSWGSCGCLIGLPASRPADSASEQMGTIADLLLDSLSGTPFLVALLASCEPATAVENQITEVQRMVEEIDRTHLRLGDQSDVDRAAMRAHGLLDQALEQLEPGRAGRLWRTAVLLCSEKPELTAQGLGLIAGALGAGDSTAGLVPVRGHLCSRSEAGLPVFGNLLTATQMSMFCFLPGRDRAGFRRTPEVDFDVDRSVDHDALRLGVVLDRGRPAGRFALRPATLTRHALVAGHTGAGKTNTVKRLLGEIAALKVPFLVLEPAKREYRELKNTIPDLVVLRAGAPPDESRTPLLINPFAFPKGFALHTHIDFLKTSFVASFGFVPPTPYLLESAILDVYERRGWDVMVGSHATAHDPLSYPTLTDLLESVDTVVTRAGYDHEVTRNLQSALRTRLGSLCAGPKGLSLNTSFTLPDRILFNQQTIIELADMGSDDEKSFVMGLILTRLFEVRSVAGPAAPDSLAHLLVIEEAHRLLRRTAEKSAEEGNMRHQAVQTFVNLLAELRAFGQGVLAVEQLPSKLAPEVVKLSGTKIIHRLLPADDRDEVGGAMALSPSQRSALARLAKGEAVCHSEDMDGAMKLRVEHVRDSGQSPANVDSGATDALTANERAQVRRVVTAACHCSALADPEIGRRADGVLCQLMAAGRTGDSSAEQLRAAIRRPSSRGRSLTDEVSAEMYLVAIEDALLRRVKTYGWASTAFDDLRALVPGQLAQLGRELGKRRSNLPGPMELCAQCTSPCLWIHEGETLAAQAGVGDEISDVLESGGTRTAQELVDALTRCAERAFGDDSASRNPALHYCTLTHVLARWGLTRRANAVIVGLLEGGYE